MKSIVEVRHLVKIYERGVEIGIKVESADKARTDRKKKSRVGGKRGTIEGFSRASRRRLRQVLASARPRVPGEYVILGLCLTVPNHEDALDDAQAREMALWFGEALHLWQKAMARHFPSVGWVWRVELTKKRMPHCHLVGYVPVDVLGDVETVGEPTEQYVYRAQSSWVPSCDCAGIRFYSRPVVFRWKADKYGRGVWPSVVWFAREAWLNRLESRGLKCQDSLLRSCDARLLTSVNCVHYLCDHESKRKQDQLGWKGRQWGICNRKALSFNPGEDIEVDSHLYARLVRVLRRCYASHKYHVPLRSASVVADGPSWMTMDYMQPRLVGVRGFLQQEVYQWDKTRLVREVFDGLFEPPGWKPRPVVKPHEVAPVRPRRLKFVQGELFDQVQGEE